MKKTLLILLCLPLLFACGDNLNKEITLEMLDNGYTGEGTIWYTNGDSYRGGFKSGKWDGYGILSRKFLPLKSHFNRYQQLKNFEMGDKYVGEFKDNKMHGKGTCFFRFGVEYVGEWKNGKQHGQGTWKGSVLVNSEGQQYEGEWKDGKKSGKGTFTWPSGNKYDGEWKDGKKSGKGTFTWSSGNKYEGEWKDGKRNGQGKGILVNGTIQEGLWEDGKFLGDVLICIEEIKNCLGYGGGESAIDFCCTDPINQYCGNVLTYEVNQNNAKKWVSDMNNWVNADPKNKEKLFFLSEKIKFESRKTGNKELYYIALDLIEEVIIYGI